ncbi:F0F1 ATP synthase subunit delta [Nocardioides sp. GCM10027113]|uniref:F0F1 ATP synthase subunit delta n=1 Tax=unclassified Nocardioides TaxID=2615069 RepID=UPI00362019CE
MTMRGASAEAQGALVDQLEQGLGSADAAKVGDDVLGLAGVVRSEAGLRRVATDVSTPSEAKAGLVRNLFEGKVEPLALDLAVEAVRRRWTASRDLADALEHLGVVALVHSAGSGDARRLADELFVVGQLVNDNVELRSALSDPARSVDDKRGLLRSLLDGKALPATVRLVEQALAGSHRSTGVAIAEYQKVAAAVYGEQVARVRVARPLNDGDRERLRQALSRQYGREVHLNVVVEPGLVGGMRVEIGDDVIDGSVSARLDEARRKLAG